MKHFLLVGLGNPGDKYKFTRHNIGFLTIDSIAEAFKFEGFRDKFKGLLSTNDLEKNRFHLLKPQTFMNLSGDSVYEIASFYKIPTKQIIIIHDDLDLELGRIKLKIGGNPAGHNGLKSINEKIPPEYLRIRFGISRPQSKFDVSDYVLSNFTKIELEACKNTINSIIKHFHLIITGDYEKFMNNCAQDFKVSTGE
jgi:PTH1 family peptidyl-tRNA hydrolase